MDKFGVLMRNVSPFWEGLGPVLVVFGIALAVTIIVEVLVGAIFFKGFKRTIDIILVQVITNPIMNLVLLWMPGLGAVIGRMPEEYSLIFCAMLAEIIVIGAEALIYQNLFPEEEKKKMVGLAMAANVSSAIVGVLGVVIAETI